MTVKIWKTDNPVMFHYSIQGEKVALETYAGSTLLLSALNEYISFNSSDKTRWVYIRDQVDNTPTSYMGRDGVLYKFPQPTFVYEKVENGINAMTGTMSYRYVRIDLENEGNSTDEDLYVESGGSMYQTMAVWKAANLYTAEPTAEDGNFTALKESITGFTLPITKLNSVIGLNGEPLNSALPRDLVLMFSMISIHYHSRLDRIAGIDSNGLFEF